MKQPLVKTPVGPRQPCMPVRFAIVEDSVEERRLYVDYLNRTRGLRCVGGYNNAEQALKKAPKARPDLVLMDLRLPGMSGTECAQRLKAALPKVKIVMITGVTESARESFGKGVDGYLTKPLRMKELREAIRLVCAGGVPMSGSISDQFGQTSAIPRLGGLLTPTERKIMELLDEGLAYKTLADRLGVRFGTIQQHLQHIYKKLGVHSRTEAVNKHFGRRAH